MNTDLNEIFSAKDEMVRNQPDPFTAVLSGLIGGKLTT